MADVCYIENSVMADVMSKCGDLNPPVPGTLVEGTVILIAKNKVLVDLGGLATGLITGQEAYDSLGTMKDLKPGDGIFAYVLDEENDDGLVVLSLRKASQEKTWTKFNDSYENNKPITVTANEANKGGLLLNIDGIKGFIPVSQLAPLHYPRVDGADSNEILSRLQKLIGIPLSVRILNLDREGGKLILSEKAAEQDNRDSALGGLNIGDRVNGKISGVVKFGIFVTFGGLEGLVHISEIAWGHVKDPNDYGKLGDSVEVLVIGKDKDKISLSMKRLMPDPWVEATKKYQVGTKVKGKISRITPFGAFMKLEDDINGLIHVTEIGEDVDDPNNVLKVGEEVEATVIAIDPEDHRVGLSLKKDAKPVDLKVEKEEKEKSKKSKEKDEEETAEAEVEDKEGDAAE
ncbi:S1 RNA-binding domain-containing protein [Candidatus Peregrinibacteria bacterium]|nr:S1 RNA-binding domain-containing protein [Candidatus Peregrinibacteria bacterium]